MNSGYKGYALGMFVELITSIMSGGAVAHNVRSWTTYDKEANLGQCFAAINPDMFCPNLPERLQELQRRLQDVSKNLLDGFISVQDAPKILQDASKTPPESSKNHILAHLGLQDASKAL